MNHDPREWDRVARRLRTPTNPNDLPGAPKPTAQDLERHALKYGPEGVKETAEEIGLDVVVDTPPKRRRK